MSVNFTDLYAASILGSALTLFIGGNASLAEYFMLLVISVVVIIVGRIDNDE